MSSVSKSVEINLDAEDRELLEKAIAKCKEIAHQCGIEGIFAYDGSVYECLSQDYDSNRGKLSAQVDIEERGRMTDYKRAFKIACDLLNGAVLYGVDTDKIFELMMQKDGIVSNSSYEDYILNHLQELDQGQYASSSEKIEHVREFEGIEVNYPPEELCTYPE